MADASEPLGARLRRLRVERGLSQRDLQSPGVTYAYISRIESGSRRPSVRALRELAPKLGVSVEYLETGRDATVADERELRLADAELRLRLRREPDAAEAELRAIVQEAELAGDRGAALRARLAVAHCAAQREDYLAVVELVEAARRDYDVDPLMYPDVYAALGNAYSALGAATRAVALFDECVARVRAAEAATPDLRIRYATYLSYALTDANDFARARDVVTEALNEAASASDSYTRVRLHWASARLLGMQGRTNEALHSIRQAIALLHVTDNTLMLGRAHLIAAGISITDRNADEAADHIKEAKRLIGPQPEAQDVGMLHVELARLAILTGDAARAIECAQTAIAALDTKHGGEQGEAIWALAQARTMRGDTQGALDAYARAFDLLGLHGRRAQAIDAGREYAEALRGDGQTQIAAAVEERVELLKAAPAAVGD